METEAYIIKSDFFHAVYFRAELDATVWRILENKLQRVVNHPFHVIGSVRRVELEFDEQAWRWVLNIPKDPLDDGCRPWPDIEPFVLELRDLPLH